MIVNTCQYCCTKIKNWCLMVVNTDQSWSRNIFFSYVWLFFAKFSLVIDSHEFSTVGCHDHSAETAAPRRCSQAYYPGQVSRAGCLGKKSSWIMVGHRQVATVVDRVICIHKSKMYICVRLHIVNIFVVVAGQIWPCTFTVNIVSKDQLTRLGSSSVWYDLQTIQCCILPNRSLCTTNGSKPPVQTRCFMGKLNDRIWNPRLDRSQHVVLWLTGRNLFN